MQPVRSSARARRCRDPALGAELEGAAPQDARGQGLLDLPVSVHLLVEFIQEAVREPLGLGSEVSCGPLSGARGAAPSQLSSGERGDLLLAPKGPLPHSLSTPWRLE